MAPDPAVLERLQVIASKPIDQQPALYENALAYICDSSSADATADNFIAVISTLFEHSSGVVMSRSILAAFVARLRHLKNHDLWIDVGNRTLDILAAQSAVFPDAVAVLRELIATAHENNEDFVEAAKVLADTPLDLSQRQVTIQERATVWIRIVRNYLEVDDSTAASAYISKLKNIMHRVEDQSLTLHFNLSQARILDAQREFLSAANKYHEISFSLAIAEEERLHTLSMAAKCAILAPAGPLRSRTLGRLYKDERSAQLDEFGILEKIFLDRVLTAKEVETFAEGLQPHQLATTADGTTVLAKAVMEHNLLGVSKLYSNIRFDALGSLLGLDANRAEETTARMIEQGRLAGRIDQLDGLVYFDGGEASGQKGSGRTETVVGKEMRRWDANVESLSEEVENITNALHEKFPAFVEANLA